MASELTLSGWVFSGEVKLVAPFQFVEAKPSPSKPSSTTFRTRITVAPTTPLGIYPARVQTDEGLSDPFPLAVGQIPVLRESQDDGTAETAPLIPTPVVIEGQLSSNKDRDYLRFRGKKDQRILIEPQFARLGSRFDPFVELTGGERTFNGHAGSSFGYPADKPLFAILPRDDDYLVTVEHERVPIKSGRPDYRLIVGELPAAKEIYPLGGRRGQTVMVEIQGGTLNGVMNVPVALNPAPGESIVRIRAPTTEPGPGGTPLDVEVLPPLIVDDLPELLEPTASGESPLRAAPPVVFNGRITPPQEDHFILEVSPGQKLRVEVSATDLGSWLNAELKVLDARGNILATSSGTIISPRGPVPEHGSYDPSAEFTVPAEQTEVTLVLSGRLHIRPEESRYVSKAGSPYRIKVIPVVPGFDLELNEAQVNVPRGGARPSA